MKTLLFGILILITLLRIQSQEVEQQSSTAIKYTIEELQDWDSQFIERGKWHKASAYENEVISND